MGTNEALDVMDILLNSRTVTPENVRRYVVPALTGGARMIEGSPEYDNYLREIYRDLRHGAIPSPAGLNGRYGDNEIELETAIYLRTVIEEASKGRYLGNFIIDPEEDGEVIHEVGTLLGREGRRYLGFDEIRYDFMPELFYTG